MWFIVWFFMVFSIATTLMKNIELATVSALLCIAMSIVYHADEMGEK